MRRTLGVALLLLVGMVAQAVAQDAECRDAGTQADLNACSRAASSAADQRLTSLLHELRPTLGPERLAAFDSAQAAWGRYRLAHCDWVASKYDGGSLRPTILSSCWSAVTERRIAELKGALCEVEPDCPEAKKYDPPRSPRRRP